MSLSVSISILSSMESLSESPNSSSAGAAIPLRFWSKSPRIFALNIKVLGGISGLKFLGEWVRRGAVVSGSDSSGIESQVSISNECCCGSTFL